MKLKHTSPTKPEWIRVSEATSRFGLSRGSIYRLINRGEIKSISLGKDSRSCRLLNYDSIVEFLERRWEEQSKADE
ncbi:MAG: helix-turn-helix domain-containing protein [Luteolibacter sp.]